MSSSGVHLVGVGGAGMSGLARVLLARGVPVSGSDAALSPVMEALRSLGAQVHVGHHADHVARAGTVVVSSAIRADNPEVAAARSAGIRVLKRAEALAQLLTGHRAVAVAGTHGKTSTTSMLVVAAQHCGADPSFVIGGDLTDGGLNAHQGTGDLFVVEADESDGSFLSYRPFAAVVTNVEPDHLDHYGTADAVHEAFASFCRTVDPLGFVVICADDEGAVRLAASARADDIDVRTYGTHPGADLQLTDLVCLGSGSSYRAVLHGESLGTVQLAAVGEHQARNSAAALLVAVGLGLPAAGVLSGLAAFSGVRRRMELKGVEADVRVYDDYAHHPTEVRAQLRAARAMAGTGRLVVVFQPHLYSRTVQFADEFGDALALADEVVVMDIYGAREAPVPGVTGQLVAERVALEDAHVHYEPVWADVAERVVSRCVPGDLVVTLGAGDITLLGPEVLQLLAARR